MPRAPRPGEVTTSTRELDLDGRPLRYTLRQTSRARGLRVTIHPQHGVVVSVPPANRRGWADPVPHVEAFVRARAPWIRRHVGRQEASLRALDARPALGAGRAVPFLGESHEVRLVPASPTLRRSQVVELAGTLEVLLAPRDRTPPETVLSGFFRERAREAIEAAIARHADALRVAPRAITLRDPRTRWGSCSRAGRLSFSWRLILAPPEALESVVVHELCHLRVFGHGPRFRSLLASRIPAHIEWRRWLHAHAAELHTALDGRPSERAA